MQAQPAGPRIEAPPGRVHTAPEATLTLERTRIAEALWSAVQADDKKKARLNCIHHLLEQTPCGETAHPASVLPVRVQRGDHLHMPARQGIAMPGIY